MPVKYFYILLLFISGNLAFGLDIDDSKNILKFMPGWGNRLEFHQAFNCEKAPLPFFIQSEQCSLSCSHYSCETKCKFEKIFETLFYTEGCGSDTIGLFSDRGHSIETTAAIYNQYSRSMILDAIQFIPNFLDPIYKIKVVRLQSSVPVRLIEDGRMKSISAIQLELALYPNPDTLMTNFSSAYILFDATQAGLNQILCISDDAICNKYFYKRKGLFYGR